MSGGGGVAAEVETAREVDPADTRALVLHMAQRLFVQHGYAAVSMNQIVEEISAVRKLSKPAIYYHFADKEALFTAVLLDLLERRGRLIAAAGATDGDLRVRVAALVRAAASGHEYDVIFRSAFSELGEEAREQHIRSVRANLFGPLIAAFEDIARRGELRPGMAPGIAASALWGIASSLAFAEKFSGKSLDVAALTTDILLGGIAAPDPACGARATNDPDG